MATYYAKETHAAWGDSMHPDIVRSTSTQNICWVQGSNAYWYRTFLRYNLSGIPYKSVIHSAKLRVYDCWHNDNGGSGTTNIARVTEDWDESTLCWNRMPGTTGLYLSESVSPPGVGNWSDWDITALVQEWVSGEASNFGLMVVNHNEGEYRVDWKFYNRVYSGGTYATYIEIDYTPEPEVRITNARMDEIAAQVRRITGTTEALTPAGIVSALEAVAAV